MPTLLKQAQKVQIVYKTSFSYFLIRAFNGLVALATVYVLTRILSAEQYGFFSLGVAGIGLGASVLFQWIAVAVSRFYGRHSNDPAVLLSEAYRFFVQVAAVGLAMTAMFAVWQPIPITTPSLALAVGVGAVAMGLHSLNLQVANARGEPHRYGLLTASRGVLALVAAFIFIQAGCGAVGAVFGVALASAMSVALFGARPLTNKGRYDSKLRREMVAYAFPLSLNYLSLMVLDVSDRFIIGWWMGPSAVAGYAAPYDLTQQTMGVALNILFLASYPRIVGEWEAGGARAARDAMVPLSKAMLLVAPLVSGLFIGLSEDISQFLLGPAVGTEAARVMPWVALAIIIGALKNYFFDIAFQLARLTHVQLRITLTMAALNLVLNLTLIPRIGVVGAAMSTAIAFAIGVALSWWFGRRLGIYPARKRDVLGMVLVLLAIVSVVKAIPKSGSDGLFDSAVRLFLGAGAYIVAVLAMNVAGIRLVFVKKAGAIFKRDF